MFQYMCVCLCLFYALCDLNIRFKLHLMAKDDTAETKFILLDWVATLVIGVKAEKILMALSMRYLSKRSHIYS